MRIGDIKLSKDVSVRHSYLCPHIYLVIQLVKEKKNITFHTKMSSGPEFTDHLFVATQRPWQSQGCNSFHLGICRDKATVVCALYCDNRLCWEAKGATLDL